MLSPASSFSFLRNVTLQYTLLVANRVFFSSIQLWCNSTLRYNSSGKTTREHRRRAFLFSSAEHRERIIPGSFPTSYAALSRVGRRVSCEFRYKNNGRVPHYFSLRAIVPTEDASRIVMRAGLELANCSRVISMSERDREVEFVSLLADLVIISTRCEKSLIARSLR